MALTKKDLQQIKELISENNKSIFTTIFEYFDHNFGDVARKKDISHLPTKDEFYAMEDKLLSEVQAEREENDIQQNVLERHDKQIKKLEKRVFVS